MKCSGTVSKQVEKLINDFVSDNFNERHIGMDFEINSLVLKIILATKGEDNLTPPFTKGEDNTHKVIELLQKMNFHITEYYKDTATAINKMYRKIYGVRAVASGVVGIERTMNLPVANQKKSIVLIHKDNKIIPLDGILTVKLGLNLEGKHISIHITKGKKW